MPGFFRRLTRDGRIIIRVYGGNWRDIVIRKGPHAGKATQPPPHGGEPHIMIDQIARAKRDALRMCGRQ